MADFRARTFAVALRRIALSLLLALFWSGPIIQADEWPQFRGPSGQGHSAEAGLPIAWSESQNVVWKTPVPGRGWSSPVVAGGRVWVTTSVDEKGASLRAMAFDVASGREAVNVEVFRLRSADLTNPKNSHASPTPIVEGDRLYVHFGAEGTAALTTSSEMRLAALVPSASIVHQPGELPPLRAKRIPPSGVQVAEVETPFVVRRRTSVPSGRIV